MFDLKTRRADRQEAGYCPNCGQALGDSGKFCSGCGAKTERGNPAPAGTSTPEDAARTLPQDARRPNNGDAEPVSPPPLPAPRTEREPLRVAPATHCGRPMPEGSRFCPFCATPLAPQGPRFSILAKTNGKLDRRFDMDGDEFVIGKTDQCHLRLPNDDFASRQHARIVRSGEQVLLEDLGSANGTFLRVRRTMALDPGDEVLVGTTVLRVEKNQG